MRKRKVINRSGYWEGLWVWNKAGMPVKDSDIVYTMYNEAGPPYQVSLKVYEKKKSNG